MNNHNIETCFQIAFLITTRSMLLKLRGLIEEVSMPDLVPGEAEVVLEVEEAMVVGSMLIKHRTPTLLTMLKAPIATIMLKALTATMVQMKSITTL